MRIERTVSHRLYNYHAETDLYLPSLGRDEDDLSLPLGDHGRQQGLGGVDTAQDVHPEDLLQGVQRDGHTENKMCAWSGLSIRTLTGYGRIYLTWCLHKLVIH